MTAADVNQSYAATLVDEWARAGVTHAVVSPGSRNTPLLLALARDARFRVDVVLDERSAAFRALGLGLATKRPAVLCCTSGTAAANFHPAVLEAHHARVPMLVCTADRPPELHDCGAPQTVDQQHLYGSAVRWFFDAGPPRDNPAHWRALASRAYAEAIGRRPGPVHLNVPFAEPLVGPDAAARGGRPNDEPWTDVTAGSLELDPTEIAPLATLMRKHPRGLLVAGWGADIDPVVATRFAAATGWPILADPLSQLRTGAHAISTYEALVRAEPFARAHTPEMVLRVGAPLTSKATNAWLAASTAEHVLVDPAGGWADPDRVATRRIEADADALLRALTQALNEPATPGDWIGQWCDAEAKVRAALDAVLDEYPYAIEGRIARDVAAAVPDGGSLFLSSSLPVRALEWCMAPRAGLRVLSNRGANGIDGFSSTAAGIAAAGEGPVVALGGDLAFLHDTNGLLHAAGEGELTYVVIDNDGGGIFSFLPQRDLAEFEQLFATPHGRDLVAIARAHGVEAAAVRMDEEWKSVFDSDVQVAVVKTDRHASVEGHRALWEAAATVLGD
jgi:2-succinyl-5-enolpyruvyl-6-hydroxy-3-cyclohexene-1-carboxylate synthase